jgi:hypothetical protein
MLGLIYPECSAPQTSHLNDKEMVIYQNLYSHFCINKSITLQQAQKYVMMYILKHKHHNLQYNKKDELTLEKLILFTQNII